MGQYLVKFEMQHRFIQWWYCQAEDADHAIEQCYNAWPSAFIHEVFLSVKQDVESPTLD